MQTQQEMWNTGTTIKCEFPHSFPDNHMFANTHLAQHMDEEMKSYQDPHTSCLVVITKYSVSSQLLPCEFSP